MDSINVAVVDDSVFMRKLISDIINEDDRFVVVAKFRNGKELIEKADDYKIDIITLDIEMPVLDGLSTLDELNRRGKRYPIIMLSSLTSKGSEKTMECLSRGALDFIEKPSGYFKNMSEIKNELKSKILAITKARQQRTTLPIVSAREKIQTTHEKTINSQNIIKKTNIRRTSFNGIEAILIGASTGGPKALQKVLPFIEADVNVPVFVVQHMPKGFTKAFADRMNNLCKLKVVEAEQDMEINKNTIYIAPGGYHMTVGNGTRIKLNQEPQIWGVRPAVDKLFESAVKIYDGKLVSAILTGMGRDGARGTELVKDSGGVTISEAEETCTIYGMPKAAFETGKVDFVLNIDDIGRKISSITKER